MPPSSKRLAGKDNKKGFFFPVDGNQKQQNLIEGFIF